MLLVSVKIMRVDGGFFSFLFGFQEIVKIMENGVYCSVDCSLSFVLLNVEFLFACVLIVCVLISSSEISSW